MDKATSNDEGLTAFRDFVNRYAMLFAAVVLMFALWRSA